MASMPMTTGTIKNASTGGINTVISLVISTHIVPMQSTPIILTRSTDTKKKLHFEDEVNNDLVTTGTEGITLPDGVVLTEDMMEITQSEALGSDDEFSMLCVEGTAATNWPFSPITNVSQ